MRGKGGALLKWVRAGLLGLTLLSVLLIFEKSERKLEEKNIFHSSAFNEYFSKQGYSEWSDPAQLNQQFIEKMRKTEDPAQIQNMFLGVDLTPSYEDFLYAQVPPFLEGDFFEYLKTTFTDLKSRYPKSKTTLSNDSYSEGNLPFLQFELSGIKVIRMGLPMIETSYFQSLFFPPSINPEFVRFIRLQKRHLYVNLMKREGLEGPASVALEALELKEPKLAIVTLDKNSDFYWQKGNYPDTAAEFKSLFLKKLTDKKGAYYWSYHLENWPSQLEEILEDVHRSYFPQNDLFTKEERQAFIELAYLEILDRLTQSLLPSSLNITCKHAIDRGPSLAVLWQMKKGAATERQVTALLLAPPLLMHNRMSHKARLDRFIATASFFYPKKK